MLPSKMPSWLWMLTSRMLMLKSPLTTFARQLDGDQVRHGLVLRPFDFVLDDVLAELRCEPVQLVAVGFVYDDVARRRVAVPHDLVSGDRLAAFGDFELGFCRRFLFRGGFARGGRVVAVLLMNSVQNLRILLLELTFRTFSRLSRLTIPAPILLYSSSLLLLS